MWIWMVGFLGPLVCSTIVLLWWLLFSRATGRERIIGFLTLLLLIAIVFGLADPTMRGPATVMVTIPMGMIAFCVGTLLCFRMLSYRRTMIALLLATCGFGYSALLRNEGMWGEDGKFGLQWRWQTSHEQALIAAKQTKTSQVSADAIAPDLKQALASPEWPAFRGVDRSGRQRGSVIATDWSTQPPELLWKVAVGPGWSSFTVAGNLLFTQEQRGEEEAVVCYDANTGNEIWRQQVKSRFSDPLGGPGPRATPTLANGALYALGANGILLRLNPKNGEIAWQQDIRKIADREPPTWGYSSSPLVTADAVIVHAGGAGDKGLLAFDINSGDLRWGAPSGDHSYSSPQPSNLAGEEVILMLTNQGMNIVSPVDGKERLNYEWQHESGRILQPQIFGEDSIVVPTATPIGTRRIQISNDDGKLVTEELWTSRKLKSDFNDFVIYQGHAYGFDQAIFTCINLEDGKRAWKKGRYGKGQVLLLEDAGLLLVVSEKGELVLLKADPAAHTQFASIQALEGKTWNHPVLINDRLYMRNSQEAACYRLQLAPTTESQLSLAH